MKKRPSSRPPTAPPQAAGAVKASVVTVVINLILSAIKFVAGWLGHSDAMISDAIHSASDVFSTFIVIAGVKMSQKREDRGHPYGHERMECVASIILAVILAIVGLGISWTGTEKILAGNYSAYEIPGLAALLAAILSIVVKEWMFWYTRAAAKRAKSGALMADAWHHRSDALSSVGSFVGILFARLGFPIMDPIAGVVIGLCVVKAAWNIFKDGLDKMVDHSCDAGTEQAMREVAAAVPGVRGIDELKTRLFGSRIYVDLEILADGELSLSQAHQIAEQVHDEIERNFPECKHCMVHVNPLAAGQAEP